jgi:HEAT repeat protein
MKADTLTNYLKDEEPEIRRAAALACALKESKAHVPQLIEVLRDPEPDVARAAEKALRELTGQKFGPAANATPAERDKAIAAWQEWWKKQK